MPGQFRSRLKKWARKLHVCVGLSVSPFILLFAITAVLFNHAWVPWSGSEERIWKQDDIVIPPDLADLELAETILSQLGITGEIRFFRPEKNAAELLIPVMKPRKEITVRVDVENRRAVVSERNLSFWEALLYLHKSPGPHLAGFRGNWFYTSLWRWVADTSIYSILFVSVSGVYLWTLLHSKRRAGLTALGVGAGTLIVVISFLVR